MPKGVVVPCGDFLASLPPFGFLSLRPPKGERDALWAYIVLRCPFGAPSGIYCSCRLPQRGKEKGQRHQPSGLFCLKGSELSPLQGPSIYAQKAFVSLRCCPSGAILASQERALWAYIEKAERIRQGGPEGPHTKRAQSPRGGVAPEGPEGGGATKKRKRRRALSCPPGPKGILQYIQTKGLPFRPIKQALWAYIVNFILPSGAYFAKPLCFQPFAPPSGGSIGKANATRGLPQRGNDTKGLRSCPLGANTLCLGFAKRRPKGALWHILQYIGGDVAPSRGLKGRGHLT